VAQGGALVGPCWLYQPEFSYEQLQQQKQNQPSKFYLFSVLDLQANETHFPITI